MDTFVRILIVGDGSLVKQLEDALSHPQIVIDHTSQIPENKPYHFYVLGGSVEIGKATNAIRKANEGSPIYLHGSICKETVPIKKLLKCNIAACLDCEEGMADFINEVKSFQKRRVQIHEAACKLDSLKVGDLKTLAKQIKKAKSERFVDYIQNHPLPMVLVSREAEVLHANTSMEKTIGTRLPGIQASKYWVDKKEFERAVRDLKREGQLLGREVTLKNVNGQPISMKLYTSLHYDESGDWDNTRCLFVPTE